MKETFVPARKMKRIKKVEFKNEKFWFPIGGIVIACLILLVLTSANGRKKVEIFRQVIAQNIPGIIEDTFEEEFVIENKDIDELKEMKDTFIEDKDNSVENNTIQSMASEENKNVLEEKEGADGKEQKLSLNDKEDIVQEKEEDRQMKQNNYEEYIVENGET